MTTDELRPKTETVGLWMIQVMCNQDIKRICDGTCNDPCCMQKHPPTTYALQAADELRAKFEAWALGAGLILDAIYASDAWVKCNIAWCAWQAAHASRDAEVESLKAECDALRQRIESAPVVQCQKVHVAEGHATQTAVLEYTHERIPGGANSWIGKRVRLVVDDM